MARPGMSHLVAEVRRLSGASSTEYTAAGTTWWTDDQIEAVLDRHRRDITSEQLISDRTPVGGGSSSYITFRSRHSDLETGAGAAIRDGLGDLRGTATYTLDGTRGVITFTDDQGGTALYLTTATYDVHGAAAEVLENWSTALSLDFQFATDGQSFHREQKAHALAARAGEQRRRAWARTVRFT